MPTADWRRSKHMVVLYPQSLIHSHLCVTCALFLSAKGMVTKRTLEDLVLNLLQHVTRAEGNYRDELIAKIIFV